MEVDDPQEVLWKVNELVREVFKDHGERTPIRPRGGRPQGHR
jgi:hypothetical protein